ncbi:MAG: S49 family peptidase [Patescibacteria group bacterium]
MKDKVKKPLFNMEMDKSDQGLLAFLRFMGLLVFLIAAAIIIKNELPTWFSSIEEETGKSDVVGQKAENCNVSGILLRGDVVTYISPADYNDNGGITVDEGSSEVVASKIDRAEKDDDIKAIILEVDSYGGSGVAGEEIANALKKAKKPTVVLIRNGAASAAYWAATGAGRIFASQNSDIGGIGVTMSYLDNVKQNQKMGYTYNLLSSGKFKDTGNPDKPLTKEEVKLLMRDVNIMHQNFIKAVSVNRRIELEKVAGLADGSTMLGEVALQNNLIDQIGGQAEVNQYLKDKIGVEPEICW